MRKGLSILNIVLVVIVLTGIALTIVIFGDHLRTAERDKLRKQSINAIHYSLEYEHRTSGGHYPLKVSSKSLTTVDESQFIDPRGNKIGDAESDYRYEPFGCSGDICQGYTLRAQLESEDDYIKTNN